MGLLIQNLHVPINATTQHKKGLPQKIRQSNTRRKRNSQKKIYLKQLKAVNNYYAKL